MRDIVTAMLCVVLLVCCLPTEIAPSADAGLLCNVLSGARQVVANRVAARHARGALGTGVIIRRARLREAAARATVCAVTPNQPEQASQVTQSDAQAPVVMPQRDAISSPQCRVFYRGGRWWRVCD